MPSAIHFPLRETTTTTVAVVMVVVVILACEVAQARGDESCREEVLHRRVQSCFSTQGLQLPSAPQHSGSERSQDASQLLRETQTMDPEHLCKDKESYKAAANCTLMTLQACLAVARMDGAIPDVARFQQGVDIICDRKADLNTKCLKARYPDVIGCGERMVRQLVELKETEIKDITDIICLSAEVNYDCAREHLKSCGEDTMQIFLMQLDKYQVPSVCMDKSPGRPGRKPHNVTSRGGALHCVGFSLVSCFVALISLVSVGLLH